MSPRPVFALAGAAILAGALLLAGRGLVLPVEAGASYQAGMSHDYVLAAQLVQQLRDEGRRLPRTEQEFVRLFASTSPALQATRLEGTRWLDPWGSPIHYRRERLMLALGESVRIYSDGPDRHDDRGYGDDVPLDSQHPVGAAAARVISGLVDE
ncbi:MAG: hypothetical protein JXX28_16120 [Deltaproteobacteria bacterium]|nr:hypothetical protein [Deltaproteobacteria bacterium]